MTDCANDMFIEGMAVVAHGNLVASVTDLSLYILLSCKNDISCRFYNCSMTDGSFLKVAMLCLRHTNIHCWLYVH